MANKHAIGDSVHTVNQMVCLEATDPKTGEDTETRLERRAVVKIVDINENNDYVVETRGGLHCIMSEDEVD